jgi:hypothetical protein
MKAMKMDNYAMLEKGAKGKMAKKAVKKAAKKAVAKKMGKKK